MDDGKKGKRIFWQRKFNLRNSFVGKFILPSFPPSFFWVSPTPPDPFPIPTPHHIPPPPSTPPITANTLLVRFAEPSGSLLGRGEAKKYGGGEQEEGKGGARRGKGGKRDKKTRVCICGIRIHNEHKTQRSRIRAILKRAAYEGNFDPDRFFFFFCFPSYWL